MINKLIKINSQNYKTINIHNSSVANYTKITHSLTSNSNKLVPPGQRASN